MSTFDIDEVVSTEEISKSLSFSEVYWSVLTKFLLLVCIPLCASLLLIARGHPVSMHANRERRVIENEYRYVQEDREELSLFLFWQHRCVISNKKPINSNESRNILIQNLEFRSKYEVFQINNFKMLGFLHIWFEILGISSIIPTISINLVCRFKGMFQSAAKNWSHN